MKRDDAMQPYLIQRGGFKLAPKEITGPDSILRFDYMGSAEFEFGALPQSLRRMDAVHAACALHETPHVSHDGHTIYLYCAGDPARAMAALDLVATEGKNFKQTPHLKTRLTGENWRGKLPPTTIPSALASGGTSEMTGWPSSDNRTPSA